MAARHFHPGNGEAILLVGVGNPFYLPLQFYEHIATLFVPFDKLRTWI
jgi:hypothetical protein